MAVGDPVELNQIIAEVETAKAMVDLPSPYAGVVRTLHEVPGTTVSVAEPILIEVEEPGQDDGGKAPGGPVPQRQPNLVGYGAAAERNGRPARRPPGGQRSGFAAPAPSAAAESGRSVPGPPA